MGSKHSTIHIFNFFPTSQSDEHLGLEGNIITKIQAFHDMLGEDARYLSEEEEVSQHNLRGQLLYQKLTDAQTFSQLDDAEELSDLGYLQQIRQLRDEQPELFAQLKRLPLKARAGWQRADITATQLVSFFRVGRLKKFFKATNDGSTEIDFFAAASYLECSLDTPAQKIAPAYYDLLQQNKDGYAAASQEEHLPSSSKGGGHTHATQVRHYIHAALKENAKLTDDDEAYLRQVRQAYNEGLIPSQTSKRIIGQLKKKDTNSLTVLNVLRQEINAEHLTPLKDNAAAAAPPREIILSAYQSPPE